MTVAADVTINHVEADDLGHTMMLHDPKNNSNPAVFSASSSSVNTFWSSLLLSLSLEYVFAPAWNGLILWFTITAFYGAVVWYSFKLKENGTDPHLITVNSPLVCGPLSDAWPITTNTTSHHLQGPRVFRCAFMMKPFALKILLRNLRPVLLLTVPQSGAGWRAGPSKRVLWT